MQGFNRPIATIPSATLNVHRYLALTAQVSIAQSRLSPLQRLKLQLDEALKPSFNRPIATIPSATPLSIIFCDVLEGQFQSPNRDYPLCNLLSRYGLSVYG